MVGRTAYRLKFRKFKERMNVISALSNAHLPCLIWGTDAIDLIHRPSKPTGMFHQPKYLAIMESLKPENRPYFEIMVKELDNYSEKTLATRQRRKEILHELRCFFFLVDGA